MKVQKTINEAIFDCLVKLLITIHPINLPFFANETSRFFIISIILIGDVALHRRCGIQSISSVRLCGISQPESAADG
jgi:hypothetical protein